jgi:glutamine synthetase
MQDMDRIKKVTEEQNIELTRFLYTDNDGITRGYSSTADTLMGDLQSGHTYAIAMPLFSAHDDLVPDSNYGPVGELLAKPDLSTFTPIPYADRSAAVICDFLDIKTNEPSPLCPRSALKGTLLKSDYTVTAAFENEFYFLLRDESGDVITAEDSLCFGTQGMNAMNDVILEIISNLKAQGMVVEKHYPEYGPGQHEIVTKYSEALRAADNQVLFKETVKAVAARHGLIASFMPKPFEDKSGSGAHIHISLEKDGENVFYDGSRECGYSDTARYFIGGILKHLEAILAFTSPIVTSYKRLIPHNWASAFVAYGDANKETAVRIIRGLRGNEKKGFNIEFKPADGTANPYLALNALLLAGFDGIKNKTDPGPELTVDPAELSGEELRKRGIRVLPASLGEVIAALEQSELFQEEMNPILYSEYLKIKRYNWNKYLRHVSKWEVDNFLTIF